MTCYNTLLVAAALLAGLASTALAEVDRRCVSACTEDAGCRPGSRCPTDCETRCTLPERPTDAELLNIAARRAAAETRQRLSLVQQRDYLDLSGSPRTRVYVWGPPGMPIDTARPDRFFCVEMGLRPDVPPVVGFWRGLPQAEMRRVDAERALRRTFRSERLVPGPVYGNGLLPVLSYRDAAGVAYVDVRSLGLARELLAPRVAEDRTGRRTLAYNRAWQLSLNTIREGGR
jgi:hypothetical protein